MQHIVAPFAGAWIEIVQRKKPDGESWSLPLRERGLKLTVFSTEREAELVAPFAGAWIEIQTMLLE